jgi:hypothetical protein
MKLLLILCLSIPLFSWGHESLETKTHLDVYKKAAELGQKYGSQKVLVVFDIDNTLLKAKQPLGSDQWFEWQSSAITAASGEALFKTFDELLAVQDNFFQLSSMSLTEENLPLWVAALKKAGHPILLLTSRGPGLRNVTERELEKNNLWFSDSAPLKGVPQTFIEAPFKNKVSYMNGIFMTTGHHKGEALAYLMKKSRRDFKAVVFADDHARHTKRVFETFAPSSEVEVVTYRYGKEDEVVNAFKVGPKEAVNAQAIGLLKAFNKVFKK